MKLIARIRVFLDRRRRQGPEVPGATKPFTLHVVLYGEHTSDGALTLQGSIQAGLIAKALAGVPLSRVLCVDTAGCRATAEKIAAAQPTPPSDAPGATVQEVPDPTREFLTDLVVASGGTNAAIVVDDRRLEGLLSILEERAPSTEPRHDARPASITRITVSEDLSYRMRFNDTEHLESIVSNRTAGMRWP